MPAFGNGDYPLPSLDCSKDFEFCFTSFWFLQVLLPACQPACHHPYLKTEVFTHFFWLFFENQIPAISLVYRELWFHLLSSLVLFLFLQPKNFLLIALIFFSRFNSLIPGSSHFLCILSDIEDTAFFASRFFFPSFVSSLLSLNIPFEMVIHSAGAGAL